MVFLRNSRTLEMGETLNKEFRTSDCSLGLDCWVHRFQVFYHDRPRFPEVLIVIDLPCLP